MTLPGFHAECGHNLRIVIGDSNSSNIFKNTIHSIFQVTYIVVMSCCKIEKVVQKCVPFVFVHSTDLLNSKFSTHQMWFRRMCRNNKPQVI